MQETWDLQTLTNANQLVRAWRAGFVDLLLDGFDEFAATGWSAAPFKLRQIRHAALEAVRKLIRESPANVGILVAGRQHYFDSVREMGDALGTGPGFQLLRIEALSDATAAAIVKTYGGDSAHMPRLHGCLIGSLDGVATLGDLPSDAFQNCDVVEISNTIGRNAEILATDLPLGTEVLLTVLNKLFNQAGRGRRENAFVRGLDARARALVPEILGLVQGHGFAFPCRIRNQTIWLPRREKGERVADIMARPSTSSDSLIERVRRL